MQSRNLLFRPFLFSGSQAVAGNPLPCRLRLLNLGRRGGASGAVRSQAEPGNEGFQYGQNTNGQYTNG